MKTKIKQYLLPVIFCILAAVVFLPLQFSTPVQAAAGDPECWAVIVGIEDYQNIANIWWYGDKDAQALSQELSPTWGSDHIRLLTGSQATKSAILSAIDWLASNAGTNDTTLFFFAGGGEEYLWAYDSLPSSFANDISAAELSSAFSSVQASKKVFIFTFWESDTMRNSLSGSGRVIMFAAGSTDDIWFSDTLQHTFFVNYLLEAFDNYDDADTNSNYELAAEEIFNYAAPLTTQEHSTQHPVLVDNYSGNLPLLAKFVFNTNISLPAGTTILTLDGTNYTTAQSRLWVPGGSHTISVPEQVSGGTGTRYVFTGWTGGDTSSTRTVSKGSYTSNYNKEFLLTINSSYGSPLGAGWYVSGSTASFSITSYIETSDTKRYFTGWSGDFTGTTASGSLTMNAAKTLTASWRTEFLLTISSEYGTPTGAGWYDQGESVTISIEPVQGSIIRQIFDGWSGDLTSTDASASVTMSGPKDITANWHTDYLLLYIIIIIVVVVIAGGVVTFVLIRRRGRTPPVVPVAASPPTSSPPPPKAAVPTKCPNCGAEIKPGDAFCIKCGKRI